MHKIKPTWLAIDGKAEVTTDSIKFVGQTRGRKAKGSTIQAVGSDAPCVVLRSNTYFQSGTISGQLLLEKAKTKVQFRLGTDGPKTIFCGLNVGSAAYGIATRDYEGFKYISLSGNNTDLATESWLDFMIRVRGSEIEFFIQEVRVAKTFIVMQKAQLELIIQGVGRVEIRNMLIQTEKPKVFAVMQFSADFNALFQNVIKPICEDYDYDVVRADNLYTTGMIIDDIVDSIHESSLIIADITPNNPNVFYEVGFAHGIGKPTILLSDKTRDKLPFDVAGIRTLFYDNTIAGKSAVEESLRKHLDALSSI